MINLRHVVLKVGARSYTVPSDVMVEPGAYAVGRPNLTPCQEDAVSNDLSTSWCSSVEPFTTPGPGRLASQVTPGRQAVNCPLAIP